MRWWRRDGVDGLKAMASLGLLLGGVLTLAGCAASLANEGETYVSAAHMSAERTDRADDATPATAVASAEPSKPVGGGSVSGGRGPLSALISDLWGPPAHGSSPVDEEALIARAIAEHEMRKP